MRVNEVYLIYILETLNSSQQPESRDELSRENARRNALRKREMRQAELADLDWIRSLDSAMRPPGAR